MEPFSIFMALRGIGHQLLSLSGPAPNAGWALARANAGLPDPGVVRFTDYETERLSVTTRGSIGYCNSIQDPGQLIRMFHQARLIEVQPNALDYDPQSWAWLKSRLQKHGVDLSSPGEQDAPAIAQDWRELVRMAAAPAPFGDVLRGFRRTRGDVPENADWWQTEVDFNLRRAGVSRDQDRKIVVAPWAHFSTLDAERLAWLGKVDEVTRINLYSAAEHVRADDQDYAQWLNARLPSPETLYDWSRHLIFDNELAAKYQLDSAYDRSVFAKFWARAQGAGRTPGQLPGQPAGTTDWVLYGMRANTPIIGFREARELQHRLRPLADNANASVVPGVQPWTSENTKDMLKMAGLPDPLVNRLMGVVYEPLNIRIINHVLFEALRFPEIAREVEAAAGPGNDWVTNAFLDHGFTPPISRLAANAIRKTAQERYFEERHELQRKTRKDQRDLTLRRYSLGVLETRDAINQLVGTYVTEQMAIDLLVMEDDKIRTDFVEVATKEVKAAFLEGKLSLEQVGAQLRTLGVNQARQAYYVQEWVWQKNDRQRMLSTSEVIQALKKGIMTPAVALARLVNLGWTAPDAVVELALAEHEIEEAAARVHNAAASKIIAAELKAKKEAEAAAKIKAKDEAARARAAAKLGKQEEAAPLQATIAEAKYDAEALLNLDAYLAAQKKGDENKMAAEISRAAQHYTELLLTQLKLKGISPKVASEIKPVEPVAVPPPETDTGAGAGTASPTSPSSATATNSGGTSEPPAT